MIVPFLSSFITKTDFHLLVKYRNSSMVLIMFVRATTAVLIKRFNIAEVVCYIPRTVLSFSIPWFCFRNILHSHRRFRDEGVICIVVLGCLRNQHFCVGLHVFSFCQRAVDEWVICESIGFFRDSRNQVCRCFSHLSLKWHFWTSSTSKFSSLAITRASGSLLHCSISLARYFPVVCREISVFVEPGP